MKQKCILTLGRQFGSGGREIGKKIAEAMGFEFYDRELLTLAAEKSGIDVGVLEHADEKPTNSLLYSLSLGTFSAKGGLMHFNETQTNDQVFRIQSETIRDLAKDHGSCVIIGRCADYVLREDPNTLRVFIHAGLKNRAARIQSLYDLSENQAQDMIRKKDKARANYYNFYTTQRWGDSENCHLSIDSFALGIDGTVELICQMIREFMAR